MLSAIISGTVAAGTASAVILTAVALRDRKVWNRKKQAVIDEFRAILACTLQDHHPDIIVTIRDDYFGIAPRAWIRVRGESYCATAEPHTSSMLAEAKKAADFFDKKKPIHWIPLAPKPPAMPKSNTRAIKLAQHVADAYNKPGIAPSYHRLKIDELRAEWPTLWAAVHSLAEHMKEHPRD